MKTLFCIVALFALAFAGCVSRSTDCGCIASGKCNCKECICSGCACKDCPGKSTATAPTTAPAKK